MNNLTIKSEIWEITNQQDQARANLLCTSFVPKWKIPDLCLVQ